MSLLEILVVVAIFAILGVIVTRSVILTLKGSKKSESTLKVRENLNYAIGVIERQLRNSSSISECPNTDPTRVDYVDERGIATSFSCSLVSGEGFVASGSAQLTSSEVDVTSCNFYCDIGTSTNTKSVDVTLTAKEANTSGTQDSIITVSTKVFLRTY